MTDAAVVLGYLNPAHFLGGKMPLDAAAARAVIAPLAAQIGKPLEDTALAILTVANENMIKAIQEITVKEGFNPAESVLVAGGGAAGLNILPIARSLGMRQVLIPRTAGALSACGAHFSDVVREFSASRFASSRDFDYAGVAASLEELKSQLDAFARLLAARGLTQSTRQFAVEARYAGQIWELEVPLRGETLATPAELAGLMDDFHTEHERVFAVRDPDNPIECIHWRARLTALLPRGAHAADVRQRTTALAPRGTRRSWFGDLRASALEAAIYYGEDLIAGDTITGPAIIEEPTTTLVIYPGAAAEVTHHGHYRCTLNDR